MNRLLTFWRRFVPENPLVLDAAGDGGSHLQAVRELSPKARLETLPGGATVPQWLEERSLRRIDLLRANAISQLEPCVDLLFHNRIEAVLIPPDSALVKALRYHRFNIFITAGGSVQIVPLNQALPAGDAGADGGGQLLALHHRFTTPVLPGGRHMDLPGLFKQHGLEARGVIHIGAHDGEELESYLQMGFKRILFLEANPAVYARLQQRIKNRQGVISALCAVSDCNGLEILHVTSNDESSSILPLKRHLELYPQIRETSQVLVPARRLDFLLREIGQNPADYNFMHLDIQGAELMALRGSVDTLPGIDAITSEVNYEELYEGCPLVEDLDEFLEPFGFERILTFTPVHPPWGDAFYIRNPCVTMRNLGKWGRFGNQVFEYAFIRVFARQHRLHLQTGAWIGNQLFGAAEPIAVRQLPQHMESTYALQDSQVAHIPFRPVNVDLCGVFQYHTAYYAPHKELFRSLFKPVPKLQQILDQGMARLRERGKTLIVLHLRRGDYGFGLFFIPPNQWYQDWLKELWPQLDSPVLYIAADEPAKVIGDFAGYKPLVAADLKLPAFGADYYPDFYIMSQADAIAISNSSFSFAACMLNERSRAFLRPDMFLGRLIPFDPWDSEPLLHRELGIVDYRHLEQVLAQYRLTPQDPQILNHLRDRRAQVARSWSQIRGDQLPLVLAHDLWTCYRLLRACNLRDLPQIDGERPIVQGITGRLRAAAGRDAIGPFIGASLYLRPGDLPPVDWSGLADDVRALATT